jgi:hypothetical protein
MSARKNTRKRAANKRQETRDLILSRLLASPEGQTVIAVLLRSREIRLDTIDAVCPPGSLLDATVHALREWTDLRPEIGVAVVLALMSARLAQSGSVVSWGDSQQKIEMSLWMLILGPSGSGKTWVRKVVMDALDLDIRTLTDPKSAAAYMQGLREAQGRALWDRDEYGQMMRDIANGGPLSPLRDLMLRSYDHEDLVYGTLSRGKETVPHPVLTILGGTVDRTWHTCIDAAMLADGLLARHLFLVVPGVELKEPLYPRDEIVASIRAAAGDLAVRLMEPAHYRITARAQEWYRDAWIKLVGLVGRSMDPAYIRRITWNTSRYAAIYHLLIGGTGTDIGVEAMRWAWRMTQLHICAARDVLALSDASFSGRVLRMAEWLEGSGITDRATAVTALLKRFWRDLHTASEARAIVDMVLAAAPPGGAEKKIEKK